MAPMRLMRAGVPEMVKRGLGAGSSTSAPPSGKRPGQRNVAYSVDEGGRAVALSLLR